ncbi:HAD family hydrolase [Micromonospora schwarzwaldensis]|uniref:HAD family hydrolase n=1 Tax=Micromonospora sp. DSM 45708 TaxID=3111767 RepID=UPI0031E1BD71
MAVLTRERWAHDTRTRAVFFDFDGTLWDPEKLIFQAHAEIFAEAGTSLDHDLWTRAVGRIGADIWGQLGALAGGPVDRSALDRRLERRLDQLLVTIRARPGVPRVLAEVDALGLPRGIVSNSSRAWVERYSRQCGVADGWRTIRCADADPRIAKPEPALYLAALHDLRVPAEAAIAFEDTPSGVHAAKAAGIRCVAVPNPVTAALDLSAADLRLESFEQLRLAQVLETLVRP